MSTQLAHTALTLQLNPSALGFADTSELTEDHAIWIGQEEAEKAVQFGLQVSHRDYNLFVLGEAGSGRSSLLWRAMQDAAKRQPPAPDLVYVYNFSAPSRPLAFRLAAGQGNELARRMAELATNITVGKAVQAATKLADGLQLLEPESFSAWLRQLKAYLQKHAPDVSALEVNVVVSNAGAAHAPVIFDNDPTFRSLFGGIEYRLETGTLNTDFTSIRAGNLQRAHGGFLMLHLRDVMGDPQGWEKLRRYLRNGKVQIEEPAPGISHSVTLEPQAVEVSLKLVLIGSREDYYELQEADPELMRHFKAKVDFVESFPVNDMTRHASSLFVAQTCRRLGLPHISAEAVARLLLDMQREVDDQQRQSALFGMLEAWLVECAAACRMRGGERVSSADVETATQARLARHSYPERELHEAIENGDILIRVHGREVGQINALTQVDLGDYRFGSPVRISARVYPGDEGIIAIDREVEMTGPHHDKGVFILQSWLAATFSRVAPLPLSASLVFEQEYHGVEGDSASCAELYALLSALSGLPLPQGIAITGALNQHGEVMAVGGVNEKIEGYFRVCKRLGLDGSQGVMIPARNAPHLLLNREVVDAVARGEFNIFTFDDVQDGLELLTGLPAGSADANGNFRLDSALGRVQRTLEAFRKLLEAALHPKDKDHF